MRDADPRWLAGFRLLFGCTGFSLVGHALAERDFLWLRGTSAHAEGTAALVVMAACLVAITVGAGGRGPRIVHFLCASFLVRILPITCLDYSLFLIGSLWLVFINVNVTASVDARFFSALARPSARAWPVFLLGVNVGLLIFSAGIMKHLDPQWRDGLGLYFVFALPWIKPAQLSPLLGARWLFVVGNYATVMLEYSVLPLFVWPRTRRIGAALMGFFFAGLIFPFRIDPIGWLGVSFAIALWSIVGCPRAHAPEDNRSRVAVTATLAFMGAAFALLHGNELADRVVVVGGGHLYVRSPLRIVKDGDQVPSAVVAATFAPRRPMTLRRILRGLYVRVADELVVVNRYTTRLQVNHVFGMADSRGNYLYRTVLTIDDGSMREPVDVFLPDMRAGSYCNGVLVPRFLQGSMYEVGAAANWIAARQGAPPNSPADLMKRLVQFSASRLDTATRARVISASVLVRPIAMPSSYTGQVGQEGAPWAPLYTARGSEGSFTNHLAPNDIQYPIASGWHAVFAP